MLTLSDTDPFAAGSIVIQQPGYDLGRLSVYSDPSNYEPKMRRMDRDSLVDNNRQSYASSSSRPSSHLSEVQLGRLRVSQSPTFPPGKTQSTITTFVTIHCFAALFGTNSSLYSLPPRPAEAVEVDHSPEDDENDDDNLDPLMPSTSSGRKTSNPVKSPSSSSSSCSTVLDMFGRAPDHLASNGRTNRSVTPTRRAKILESDGVAPRQPPVPPLRIRRKGSTTSQFEQQLKSPASRTSPVLFERSDSLSSMAASTGNDAPISPTSTSRSLYLVRKASSSRIHMPPTAAPPTGNLPPPPPLPSSLSTRASSFIADDLSSLMFPEPPTSPTNYLSMSSRMSAFDAPSGDAILSLMQNSYDDDVGGDSTGLRGGFAMDAEAQHGILI